MSPARPLRSACPHGRIRLLLGKWLPAEISLDQSQPKPWASANFIGARHLFTLLVRAPDQAMQALGKRLQAQLLTVEWQIAGHIVADCQVTTASDISSALLLEILTVEE